MQGSVATKVLLLALAHVVFLQPSMRAQEAETGRKIVSRVNPLYPELARRMQIHGTVKVEATVAANGHLKSTKVIGGSPVLTKAALDAIGAWKWAATPGDTKELIELTFQPE